MSTNITKKAKLKNHDLTISKFGQWNGFLYNFSRVGGVFFSKLCNPNYTIVSKLVQCCFFLSPSTMLISSIILQRLNLLNASIPWTRFGPTNFVLQSIYKLCFATITFVWNLWFEHTNLNWKGFSFMDLYPLLVRAYKCYYYMIILSLGSGKIRVSIPPF